MWESTGHQSYAASSAGYRILILQSIITLHQFLFSFSLSLPTTQVSPLGGHSITQSVGCTAFASLAAQLTLSIYPTQVCPLGVAQSTGVVSRQSGSISLSFNVTVMRYRTRRMSCRSLLSRERRKSTLSSGS